MKNQKGITLVALVVTIIVLLILAGVSLNLVAGSNGIITKAANATDQNSIATAKEQVTLMIAEEVANFYEDVYVNENTDVNTKAGDWIAKKYDGNVQKTTDDYKFTVDPKTPGTHTLIIQGGNDDPRLPDRITVTLTDDGKLKDWR